MECKWLLLRDRRNHKPDGRVFGKMAHSERRARSVAMNIYGEQDLKIFESGVKYFK